MAQRYLKDGISKLNRTHYHRPMLTVALRPATRDDCPAINDILNDYVVSSTATFITDPQTLDERLRWLEGRGDRHPVIVAEIDRRVVGWAALSMFRGRAAYANTAELGVYVHRDYHRRGFGRRLVAELTARGRAAGLHAIVGGCCSESTASIALLEASGFRQVAHFHEVGFKFGRWLDVIFLERLL
jgi:phosphinothricin acetyltransferase